MNASVCVNMETNKQPKTPRRPMAAGATSARRPLRAEAAVSEKLFPVGSGLANALARRVVRAEAALNAAWPLGREHREEELFPYYHRAVRRWMRLRGELEQILIAGGVA